MKHIILLFLSIFCAYSINAQSLKDTLKLNEVTIKGKHSLTKASPFTYVNIDNKELTVRAQGTEPVTSLITTPSITFNSDNGVPFGYNYIRMRGIDQTRINFSLNGVPLNEPEDQGIYFNNYANFLGSIESIQLNRGAGIAKSGVSSYVGSINFNMKNANDTSYSTLLASMGSYNSGLLSYTHAKNKFYVSANYVRTDGFRYHSGNESSSIFYSTPISSYMQLYGFIGVQENGMAWLGGTKEQYENNKYFNPHQRWEKDNFSQIHNQIHINVLNSTNHKITLKGYHTYLNGYYDMNVTTVSNTDFNLDNLPDRLQLKSNWFGAIANYEYDKNWYNFNLGTSIYGYKRTHYSTYSSNYPTNSNSGNRDEFTVFAKQNIRYNNLNWYTDIQYKDNRFKYKDFTVEMNPLYKYYNFVNLSTGLNYRINKSNIYWGIALNNREPSRTDIFNGCDAFNTQDSLSNVIKPEKVIDNELGFRSYGKNYNFNFNLYHMKFIDENVLMDNLYSAGVTNGILSHINVDNSYRMGAELQFDYKLGMLEFNHSSCYSKDNIKHNGIETKHILSPEYIVNQGVSINFKKLRVGADYRFVDDMYIDYDNKYTVPSYSVVNMHLVYKEGPFIITFRANNLGDKKYYTSGMMQSKTTPVYFINAGINYMASIQYNF